MKMVALLRAVNVGGNRKVPMPELQDLARKIGFTEVETYINSGNLVFNPGRMSAAKAMAAIEKAIVGHFGFAVDVVVRTEKQWLAYASKGPFRDAVKVRPNLLMIGLSKSPLSKNVGSLLGERAAANERIRIVDGVIWVDFAAGVGRSKLTPAWFDKAAGSSVTLRNWRTVIKLADMLSKNLET